MLAKVESEELRNCRRLLDYIDGPFRERLEAGKVEWNSFEMCKTGACLLGWYVHDVLGMDYEDSLFYGDVVSGIRAHFGGHGKIDLCFIPGDTDIHDRRAALVAHIERLEAKEKAAA